MKVKVDFLSQENETLKEEVRLQKEKLIKSKTALQILEEDVRRKDEELHTLRTLNADWQKLGIEKYKKLQDLHRATMKAPSTSGGGGEQFPAIGYITEDESQIHIGRGLYLSTQAWYQSLNVPMTRKVTFARNILVALRGYDFLSRTTLSGKGSNRNRQAQKPEHKLDPKILLAIQDVYIYFLVTEKNWKKDDADIEAGRVHSTISTKIADIKRAKKKAFDPKSERAIMGDAEVNKSEEGAEINSEVNVEELIKLGNGHQVPISEIDLLDATFDEEISKSDGNDASDSVVTTNNPSMGKDEEILRIMNGEATGSFEMLYKLRE